MSNPNSKKPKVVANTGQRMATEGTFLVITVEYDNAIQFCLWGVILLQPSHAPVLYLHAFNRSLTEYTKQALRNSIQAFSEHSLLSRTMAQFFSENESYEKRFNGFHSDAPETSIKQSSSPQICLANTLVKHIQKSTETLKKTLTKPSSKPHSPSETV